MQELLRPLAVWLLSALIVAASAFGQQTYTHPPGTRVRIIPTPAPGWEPGVWSGALSGSGVVEYVYPASGVAQATVTFVESAPPPPPPPPPPQDPSLTIEIVGQGTVTVEVVPEPPPPPPGGVYELLSQRLPVPGRFALVPNSAIGSVLVQANEFSFCPQIDCGNAKNAFLAWVGMAFDEATGRWWNPVGGGHGDYGGNEAYRFDFSTLLWTRERNPTPIDGPAIPGSNPACHAQSQLPYSMHTYDGALFVPSRTELFLMGSVPWCNPVSGSGYGPADGGLTVQAVGGAWREVWPTGFAVPYPQQTRYAVTAYDAARDRVYSMAGNGYIRTHDPAQNYAVVATAGGENWLHSYGTAVFDDITRNLYWTDYGNGIFRIHIALDGTMTQRTTIVTTAWTALEAPLALAVHRPSGKLVLWGSGGRVFRVDPGSGAIEDLTVMTGEIPPNYPPAVGLWGNVIYSKWIYIEAVDTFAGVDDARDGVWLYKLPGPPQPPQPPPPPEGAQSFSERCAASGVVLCDPLDTEGPWGVGGRLMRNPDGTTGIPSTILWQWWRGAYNKYVGEKPGHVTPRLDRVVKTSGTGSLKLDYPSRSDSAGGGVFTTNFSDDLSVQFGEGETFYVQYRVRYDCDFIYFDCNQGSPTYRTTRRFYRDGSGSWTNAKVSIISTGDRAVGPADACTWLEVVVTTAQDHTLQGYHSCGWYAGFEKRTGESWFGSVQWDRQPNGTILGIGDDASPTCWTMPDPAVHRFHGWGYTGPDCFLFGADQWVTVQQMIRIGSWQPAGTGPPLSHVTIWAAHEGEGQRVVVDLDVHLRGPEETGQRYGKVWLLPFMSGKDPTEAHPTAHIWYDELIVSRTFIADPR